MLEEFDGDLRFTRQQNFILGNVPADRVEQVKARLAELGLPVDRGRAYARSIACTSHRFCNYSVAETKGKLEEMLEQLTSRFGAERIGDLAIHMDGCPHACAQHWVGEIGLQGTTVRVDGSDERVEAYDLTIGGGLGTRTAIGRRLMRRVPTTEIGGVMERLVGGWLDAKAQRGGSGASYTLGDFCTGRTDEELVALATGTTVNADAEATDVVSVHVPGPLLDLVGGQDQFEVQAQTVAEALAAVAREHPAFGAAVIPDGKVAEAFLLTVGDEDIRNLDGLATAVTVGSEISIVMAMSGG
jgi:ferredoxin-nitrite reductase